MDTREVILDAALELFSTKGFTSSSVRDICKIVGIKESSLYYHFTNKQAILDEMQNRFVRFSGERLISFEKSTYNLKLADRGIVWSVTREIVERYLLDDFINKFIRIMLIEQANNEELRVLYHQWVFDMPIDFQGRMFNNLMEAGYIRKGDSGHMALLYYTPIIFYFNQFASYDLEDGENIECFRRRIDGHIECFLKEYEVNVFA